MTEIDELINNSHLDDNIKQKLIKYQSNYIEDKQLRNKYKDIYDNPEYLIKNYGENHELYRDNELKKNQIDQLSNIDYNMLNDLNKNELGNLSDITYKNGYYLLYEKIEKFKENPPMPSCSPHSRLNPRPAASPF